ncbi:butyrate--CoA ligase AAE11, peroxisomal-like [Triticum dicoccoides]|uniref:butyrate--CoA ligase AAE11, peroxisomal-like n=1 Tax=Triticum dicoccoides TaxID=85692 RepID=UPI000E7B5242|nr:butyrate--CoA ligase AAE11, peroxisomal-like [Triticum dicoccoides]
MDSLPKRDANYVPLSPVTFLPRAAAVYANRTSLVCGGTAFTWRQTHDRCLRLAAALQALAVSRNDVVSVLAPNTPALYEMHFAVPMTGAVINAINTRLDAAGVAAILRHAAPKLLFVDYQYIRVATDALKSIAIDAALPLLVVIDDIDAPTGARVGELEYEDLLARGDPTRHPPRVVEDEWDAVALNYTSGTTSAPKGIVYSHRGAYLSTVGLLLQWGVAHEPVYLWSLPMFHCNGWTFTWGVAARGGVNVCVRTPTADAIYSAIADHGVTHMCAAPVLFNILLESRREPLTRRVEVLTGGAAPPAPLLERVEQLGFHVTHAYGMTEATGPAMVCEWREQWDALPPPKRALLKARQGVSALSLADADVKDLNTMRSVPRDGATLGEIVLRGSSVMKGYYKNPEATASAFRSGWFLTGDVGVVHPDGYVEIKDRSKDVIISGGENISSVEVEAALYGHPAVLEAAVVAMPHPHWGETPCAFVALKKQSDSGAAEVSEEELVSFCRSKMAHFMVPRKVVFVDDLPKNATGKVQKLALRERARGLEPRDSDKKRAEPAQPATSRL